MFSKNKSKFKAPFTHYFIDKEAQVVLGKKQLAPHAIYHRQHRAPYSSLQVNYDSNQRSLAVLTNIQHVLSPHLRVLLHAGDKVVNGQMEGRIWENSALNVVHTSDPTDADSVLITTGPRYPNASTLSLSLKNVALSHMQQLPTINPTWLSGHVLCRFVNEQLNLSQLAVSLRVQPETVRGLNNGVVVLKFFSKYFDAQRSNTKKKGVISASYIHRLTANWFIGGGVKFNVGDGTHRGYRLRTGERDVNWGGVLSVPRVKLGLFYQHDPLDATFKLRARLRNTDNVELTGQIEKNFSEYGLSPYLHAQYSSSADKVKFGLGVNFSGI